MYSQKLIELLRYPRKWVKWVVSTITSQATAIQRLCQKRRGHRDF